ncbi:hypothetical protein KSP40_PGU017120 [Platanthera guangdongensis]|uniref:Uncharacterized protein n=1 Tax=Platanthera guangdongensis TaxID=2320717 RepID=A0ABR2MTW8_9ASPA
MINRCFYNYTSLYNPVSVEWARWEPDWPYPASGPGTRLGEFDKQWASGVSRARTRQGPGRGGECGLVEFLKEHSPT